MIILWKIRVFKKEEKEILTLSKLHVSLLQILTQTQVELMRAIITLRIQIFKIALDLKKILFELAHKYFSVALRIHNRVKNNLFCNRLR